MSNVTVPASPALPSAEEIYRIPVDLYERIVEAGDLGPDDRIELLNGVLVSKMTKSPGHQVCTELCGDELRSLLRPGYQLRTEGPVKIPEFSEPEPDLAIVRGERRDYARTHPQPRDVVLLVEVSDSSLARDRGVKRDIYARAGVPTYWIVDLEARRVEVYEAPADGAFARGSIVDEGGSIELFVDGRAWGRIEVAAVLP